MNEIIGVVLVEKRLKELEEAARSNPITIEMVRAERARLHALGLAQRQSRCLLEPVLGGFISSL
jgi:hypothetical protein